MRRTRIGIGVAAVVVAVGCGLTGDDDALPSDGAPPTTSGVSDATVRVVFGDRWVEVAADTPTTVLEARVRDLGVEAMDPVDAGVEFDGERFVAVPARPGRVPDTDALARAIERAAAGSGDDVDITFRPVEPRVDDERAQAVASELNTRAADGVAVAVADDMEMIPLRVLGAATDVSLGLQEWDISVRWNSIDDYVTALFPDAGQPGGEATFEVIEAEEAEAPGSVRVVPGEPATVCCDARSARRIEQSLEHDIEVAHLYLDVVDGERGTTWAEELGITERVGTFTTYYTPGQSRVTNIRRIAELTQGAIIEPGGTFSLNGHVGRRTTEKGFVSAGTIINGHLVESVGGGISQFATTIFNTAFFAGMEFDTYQSHSIYFSRYPYGREATVSWPNPDLVIRNPSPYGVLIWPTTTSGSVTVDFYSTPWAIGEQTGQTSRVIQVACTRVTTERTRTFVDDGSTEIDTVFATYRPEGIACDGTETQNPDEEQIDKLENGEDPGFDDGEPPATTTTTTTTTTAPPPTTTAPTTTAPTTTAPTTTTTTTSTTTPPSTTTTTTTTTAPPSSTTTTTDPATTTTESP